MSRKRIVSVVTLVTAALIAIAVAELHGQSSNTSALTAEQAALAKFMPGAGSNEEDLGATEAYWSNRLTYPTGDFNADWVRRAAAQDARVPRADAPDAEPQAATGTVAPGAADGAAVTGTESAAAASAAQSIASTPFTALGPRPLRMTGCSGCFNYTSTEGRINAVAIDPTTTTNGAIVAYVASVGGGIWKTTTCCDASTSWVNVTDDPLIATTSMDAVEIDPTDHNTIYAGTGDLNYGSFSMGSQGVLKSTDGGAHWAVLGAGIFGAAYPQVAGQFPQYQAVGKVQVDPRNGNNVVVGTKTGLYFSYDGGQNWTSCLTNSYTTQRQDITGLELTDVGGSTRIIAAVGTRGYATPVQFDLGSNGANGIYRATMGTSGCPDFTSVTDNTNFIYGTAVSGSPYATGANLNATSGAPYGGVGVGDQLGRIDLAVAPSDPSTIYAQVQSIAVNPAPSGASGGSAGCGGAAGCQLGVFATTNGGATWTMMAGSAGGSLRGCDNRTADYPQNWYDQGVAVDPNNADRVFVDTFDVWYATRTGTSFLDLSCGYSYTGASGPVHTDQHGITFVPGSSATAIFANDGGLRASTNVDTTSSTVKPAFFDLNTGLNTIEYYSGDISSNFADTTQARFANGGAQDNGSSDVYYPAGTPAGTAQWQMGTGGDGFFARIDPVGGFMFQGGNSGGLRRCSTGPVACTASVQSSAWSSFSSGWGGDQQSFVLPYEIFKGTPGNPGGRADTDCAATGCSHMIAGTIRVWENIVATAASATTARAGWLINSPNLTKSSLGNRSYINQLAYSPATSTLGIVGTNDGNVQVGRNLGAGVANSAIWTNVTGGNATLPNRPILDVVMDPRSLNTDAAPVIGYAAVGGFDANTPSTTGHVFQVTCTVDCASFTWANKTGNLPDIPVDSIMTNPNFPSQVFAGTDFGLYVTDDITVASPTWYRLQNGMPNVMIWDMQIDRGATTLSLWTRSRGAYTWALPTKRLVKLDQTISFAPIADHVWEDADFDVSASASSGLPVTFSATGACTVTSATVHITGAGSCTVTASQPGDADTWNAAEDVSQTFTIARAPQSITVGTTEPKHFGDADFELTATATSHLAVALAVTSGPCTLSAATSPANVHITGAGTCVITASQGGDSNYLPADDVVRSFEIDKADQSITFDAIDAKTYGDADFNLAATASSGLAVAYSAVGNCSVTDGTVHITGAGSCTVTASQPGSDSYNPAPDVSRTFAIAKADQSITFAAIADKTFGDGDFTLGATASSSLDVSYAAAGDCTVTGATVHITGAGSCTITASQPGDSNYNPAADVSHTFAIAQASQTISFDSIPNATFGDADIEIAPTASSGLTVYLIVASGPCALDRASAPAKIHLAGAGTCTITATQPGDRDHEAAPAVSRSFSIAKASQTITFAAPAAKTYGDADFTLGATASSNLPVSYTASGDCTVTGATVHITAAGSCTLIASQAGDDNYKPATDASRTVTIARKPLSITANDRTKLYGRTIVLGNSAFTTTGLVGSQSIASVTLSSTGEPASAAVGNHPIVPSAAVAGAGTNLANYAITYVNGTLTVYLSGLVGLDGFTVGPGTSLIDSYDASAGSYSAAAATKAAQVLANGPIAVTGSTVNGSLRSATSSIGVLSGSLVTGDVTAGGNVVKSGSTVNGTVTAHQPSAPIVAPSVAACSPFSPAAGLTGSKFTYDQRSGDLTVSGQGSVTLAAGTYCMHSVTLSGNATLNVGGKVTLRLTGLFTASGNAVVNTGKLPEKLEVSLSHAGLVGVTLSGNTVSYLSVYAPDTTVTVSGQAELYGAALANGIAVLGGTIHQDTSLRTVWASELGL